MASQCFSKTYHTDKEKCRVAGLIALGGLTTLSFFENYHHHFHPQPHHTQFHPPQLSSSPSMDTTQPRKLSPETLAWRLRIIFSLAVGLDRGGVELGVRLLLWGGQA